MKYGESVFDIGYLLLALFCGVAILRRARNKTEKTMGLAALILGAGDAFHLVPRVVNYFSDGDLTAAQDAADCDSHCFFYQLTIAYYFVHICVIE